MSTTLPLLSQQQALSDAFKSVSSLLDERISLKTLRKKAWDNFTILGFPNKSNEEYKYSGTEKLIEKIECWNPEALTTVDFDFDKVRKINPNAYHLFLINGKLMPVVSDIELLEKECSFCSLSQAAKDYPEMFEKHLGQSSIHFQDAFAQINLALAHEGLFIHMKPKQKLHKTIQINQIFTTETPSFIQTHHIIIAEALSEANIIETYWSADNTIFYFGNHLTEIAVSEQAQLNYYRLQHENTSAVHVSTIQATQQKDSHFDTNTISIGGFWTRNNLNIILEGKNAVSHLNGLQIMSHQQHIDNHTLVDHEVPHCESNQLYKGIFNQKSSGVFNGKIFVRKDAQKTNAYQSSKNMLLSENATINTKPQLEIYADDVKCSHGSSTGKIDESALFYLQARGLSTDSARAMLMCAFANDVIQTIRIEPFKGYLESLIEDYFNL